MALYAVTTVPTSAGSYPSNRPSLSVSASPVMTSYQPLSPHRENRVSLYAITQAEKPFDLQTRAAKPPLGNYHQNLGAIRDTRSELEFMKVWQKKNYGWVDG